MARPIDERIVGILRQAGVDFACQVPCALLAGVVTTLSQTGIPVLSVTREEEGVGVCAGAFLGGRHPMLFLQNSGLGNSANALASLQGFYGLPLVLLVGYRGGPDELVDAQKPMGEATPGLLRALGIPFETVENPLGVDSVGAIARRAFAENRVCAALLRPGVWK